MAQGRVRDQHGTAPDPAQPEHRTGAGGAGDAHSAGRTTEREAYAVAGGEGGSVLEGRDRLARREIIAIRDEVEEMCHDLLTKA